MARPRKKGKRAVGVQEKKGYLYIVTSKMITKDGERVRERNWISTGLKDTPENVKKAIEMRERILEQSKNSELIVDRNISVKDYTTLYLNKKKTRVMDSTYGGYYYRGERIREYFGDTMVKDLTSSLIQEFLDSLFELDNLQKRTVKDTRSFLSSMMDQAVKDGVIKHNPITETEINKKLAAEYAKVKNNDELFFSYKEAQTFLHKAMDSEFYEGFYLTIFFGMRKEEVLGLRWSAIDLVRKVMRINHTVTKGFKQINYRDTTKTKASLREYPLTDDQVEMFIKLKKQETENKKLFGSEYNVYCKIKM